MAKLSLNSISNEIFRVNSNQTADNSQVRAEIISAGRVLMYDSAVKCSNILKKENEATHLTAAQYKDMNERFQRDHLLYCAKKACDITGETAPASFEEFKKNGMKFYLNEDFFKVLQGIYQEIVVPILPAVFSTAVDEFADVVEVGFGETYTLSIDSNYIPFFQDVAWGAQRSVPRNRFYAKDYTLNPQPKACWITAKWHQLVSNGMDFGRYFTNLAAGMYAKTMGEWNAAMTAAAADTTLIPTGLTYTFDTPNWVALANKLAALGNTNVQNIVAFGGAPALAKVLPTNATGASAANVDMDAALATLLGNEYNRRGFLGEFMGVRMMPLMDAVVPNTQNGNVTTILNQSNIYLMAANGRKPLTIGYNRETPVTLEMRPERTADLEIGINMTYALDIVPVFAQKIGLITV